MAICGIEKSSFIDYPDKISTVLFIKGCNFKCSYCHNSHIVNNEDSLIELEEILIFLKNRKKFIEAVCITGGEPTLDSELYNLIKKIKKEKFFVKLDTNGTRPYILEKLIKNNLLDYIAMDIKAPFDKYEKITQSKVDIDSIKKSIEIIINSNINYEFRTTVCKELLNEDDIMQIAEYIKGSRNYYIQNFKDGETVLEGKNKFTPHKLKDLKLIENKIKDYFDDFKIR